MEGCPRCGSIKRYIVNDPDFKEELFICKSCGASYGDGDTEEFERVIDSRDWDWAR